MVEVRQIGPEQWQLMREVRLRAIHADPEAFGSTYQRELNLSEDNWRARLGGGASFLAFDGDQPVGLVSGVWLDPTAPVLVGMWVAPEARGRGVGALLVEGVAAWARAQGAEHLALTVVEQNQAARRLYERAGFEVTGETEPLARDPRVIEVWMRLSLVPAHPR